MKQTLLTLTILFVCTVQSYGQNCNITQHYGDFLKARKSTTENDTFLITEVVNVNNKKCFADLINNDLSFIDYLLANFAFSNSQELLKLSDSLELNESFIRNLQNDSLFNSVMTELTAKTIDKTVAKDTVTLDELLNIAVKYFYMYDITDEGYYVGKFCSVFNAIEQIEKTRKPFIEAFCFSSIQKHYYKSKNSTIYDEFVKSIKELYTVNLGVSREERLLRAQGAMFLLMKNNDNLKKILIDEYKANIKYLPFILKK